MNHVIAAVALALVALFLTAQVHDLEQAYGAFNPAACSVSVVAFALMIASIWQMKKA